MDDIEVFADITCPFTHVGLRRIIQERTNRGRHTPRLKVRAWPLELVNGQPFEASAIVEKAAALREQVAPGLFSNINPDSWPASSRAALGLVAAAYRIDAESGEQMSLRLRDALFEHGQDISDPLILKEIGDSLGVGTPTSADMGSVESDWAEGQQRGVIGSPHFFLNDTEMFCPTLEITHPDGRLHIEVDEESLQEFLGRVFE